MKTHLIRALALAMGCLINFTCSPFLWAQDTGAPLLSPDDLSQLVAPIALYPDPMIALILQAATVPTDIVLADRYVQDGGDPNAIDQQNWDDSVKGLARYPDVLGMMDQNLDWTNQLGAAVLAQQNDVMAAIQTQRARANALGNLQSTPQQQVIVENQVIQIVPVDPQLIYVPVYDPQAVYIDRSPDVPLITFGIGLALGAWISGGFDWSHHDLYSQGYYRSGQGWRPHNNGSHNVWHRNPSRPQPRPPFNPGRPGNGHLPGFHRPPQGGNKPGQGGKPGFGNGNQPSGGRPPAGNRPAQNTRPAPKPQIGLPGGKGDNAPGKPTSRPASTSTSDKPAARPQSRPVATPQQKPAATRPSPSPSLRPSPRSTFNNGSSNSKRPATTRSASSSPRPQPQRSAAPRPVNKPSVSAPAKKSPSTFGDKKGAGPK